MSKVSRALSPGMRANAVREGQLIALGMLALRWAHGGASPPPDPTTQRAEILARIDLRAVPRPQRAAYGLAAESVALETLNQAKPLFRLVVRKPAELSQAREQGAGQVAIRP